jgi:hypothetical protein
VSGRNGLATAVAATVLAGLASAASGVTPARDAQPPVTPPEHVRRAEQTFLTFPEWYLVHSPAEYAMFVKTQPPSEFPFWGHIRQFWESYRAVTDATRRGGYPLNIGYHVMIMVIGVSTTGEYALRLAYENVVGRLAELTTSGLTDEDHYGARVAQDYVDFIRVRPWYEYDFAARLRGLWSETPAWGKGPLRKWERRYALTSEYLAKALYGWLIMKATKTAYEDARPDTAVWVDRLPDSVQTELPDVKVLKQFPDGSALITVPRYEAFKVYSSKLAERGVTFQEIAGNRGAILVSALVPAAWTPGPGQQVLFTQPVLTRPAEKRVALTVNVPDLHALLNRIRLEGDDLEHVYDY